MTFVENYDEKIDIYAFGMCLLEMVTKDYPYSECENAAQIFRRVTTGVKPQALTRVADPEVLNFIELCIHADPRKRPSARELSEHEFMAVIDEISGKTPASSLVEHAALGLGAGANHTIVHNHHPSTSSTTSSLSVAEQYGQYLQGAIANPTVITSPVSLIMEETVSTTSNSLFTPPNPRGSTPPDGGTKSVSCTVDVITIDWPILQLKMRLQMPTTSASKEIKFPFNLHQDTISSVLDEMIREGVLEESARVTGNAALADCLRGEPIVHQSPRVASNKHVEISPAPVQTGLQSSVEPSMAGITDTGLNGTTSGCSVGTAGGGGLSTNPVPLPPSQVSILGPAYEMIEDAAVQDHPEVAALLLRQKKEIELLALFHRREHQALLKNLKKQLGSTRTRIDSSSNVRAGNGTRGVEENGLPLPDGEDKQFMTKVRRLLYESTGNAAWLSDQTQAVELGEKGGTAL